jgi:hypothetical protein
LQNSQPVIQESLDSYKEEYSDLLDNWRELERKSQGIATIAGVFLGGIFLFFRQAQNIEIEIKIFLCLATFFLVGVFLRSISVLSIRERYTTPSSDKIYIIIDYVIDHCNGDERLLEEKTISVFYDRIRLWQGINDNINKINQ